MSAATSDSSWNHPSGVSLKTILDRLYYFLEIIHMSREHSIRKWDQTALNSALEWSQHLSQCLSEIPSSNEIALLEEHLVALQASSSFAFSCNDFKCAPSLLLTNLLSNPFLTVELLQYILEYLVIQSKSKEEMELRLGNDWQEFWKKIWIPQVRERKLAQLLVFASHRLGVELDNDYEELAMNVKLFSSTSFSHSYKHSLDLQEVKSRSVVCRALSRLVRAKIKEHLQLSEVDRELLNSDQNYISQITHFASREVDCMKSVCFALLLGKPEGEEGKNYQEKELDTVLISIILEAERIFQQSKDESSMYSTTDECFVSVWTLSSYLLADLAHFSFCLCIRYVSNIFSEIYAVTRSFPSHSSSKDISLQSLNQEKALSYLRNSLSILLARSQKLNNFCSKLLHEFYQCSVNNSELNAENREVLRTFYLSLQ